MQLDCHGNPCHEAAECNRFRVDGNARDLELCSDAVSIALATEPLLSYAAVDLSCWFIGWVGGWGLCDCWGFLCITVGSLPIIESALRRLVV